MVQDSKTVKDAWSTGKKVNFAYGKKRRKFSTILLISMDQYFFCVFFFSLCSNPSTWPGRQVDPDGSQCYFLIFDGLVVLNKSAKARAQNCPDITILNSPFVSLSFRSFVLILWWWSHSHHHDDDDNPKTRPLINGLGITHSHASHDDDAT